MDFFIRFCLFFVNILGLLYNLFLSLLATRINLCLHVLTINYVNIIYVKVFLFKLFDFIDIPNFFPFHHSSFNIIWRQFVISFEQFSSGFFIKCISR